MPGLVTTLITDQQHVNVTFKVASLLQCPPTSCLNVSPTDGLSRVQVHVVIDLSCQWLLNGSEWSADFQLCVAVKLVWWPEMTEIATRFGYLERGAAHAVSEVWCTGLTVALRQRANSSIDGTLTVNYSWSRFNSIKQKRSTTRFLDLLLFVLCDNKLNIWGLGLIVRQNKTLEDALGNCDGAVVLYQCSILFCPEGKCKAYCL